MRRILYFLLVLFVSPTAWGEGKLELSPGRWQGPVKGVGLVTLEVGAPADKTMKFSIEIMGTEVQMATAIGSYKVKSVVSSNPRFTFHVDSLVFRGGLQKDMLGGYNFGGWTLRPGSDFSGIIKDDLDTLSLDVSEGERPVHFTLHPAP